jgi:hypothetical protein
MKNVIDRIGNGTRDLNQLRHRVQQIIITTAFSTVI